MSKAISYSLFGYGKNPEQGSFDFNSYIRGLMINVRMNRLIYPDWDIVVHMDQRTYESFKNLFDNCGIRVIICTPAPLCLAMLWRLKPVFETTNGWKYERVICRDLDSPTTYREAQAVQYWCQKEKALHAITDSVSHNIPLLGGMIGVMPQYFTAKVGNTWEEMLSIAQGINFKIKGTDQEFLCKHIYPKFAQKGSESITQHYILGHGDTFLNDYHNKIDDIEIPGVTPDMAESNGVAGHIGAAGFYGPPMFKFLRKYKDRFTDLIEIEKEHAHIFNWCLDDTFK